MADTQKMNSLQLDIEPGNPTWWQIFVKFMIGLCVGIFISFLIFIILVLVWGMIQEALSNRITGSLSINPLLPLILIVISFVSTFIGTIIVAGIYNLLYPETYYDMWKMFSLTLTCNIILFFFFVPLYIIFATSIDELFVILAFHILFTVFVSYTAIQMTTNPNYSAVHLIGAAFWLTIALIGFGTLYKIIDVNEGNTANILLAIPPVLAYACIPLFHGIWEKLYYKFYSSGNNFFYIPSLSEVTVSASEEEDVIIDTDDESMGS